MKRNVCIICTLLLSLVLHHGCISEESSPIKDNDGFQLSMDEGLTRSPENEAILDNMRLYCFAQGSSTPLSGSGGSWDAHFDHQLLGVTRTNMTLYSNAVKTGNWDLVMVSAAGATLTPPIAAKESGEALMYTYNPGAVKPDGSRDKAHEVWHRMLRLPTINSGAKTTASCAFTRNASMVKVVVDRAVDIDLSATTHEFKLHDVPEKISWSGTLLRTVSPGVYETSLNNPDVLPAPLTGKFTFTDNSGVETGTYKSDTLTFIIPAHREADFWLNNTTPSGNAQDTITHKMSVSVSFAKASGGKFEKTVQIDRATRCNGILLVHLKMKDVNLELTTSVKPWEPDQPIEGNVEAPYLNISEVETTVYDAAASRIYFWSNQPADSVYILKEGDGVANVDAVFDRIAGPTAINRHYDVATESGYIDIANLTLATSQPDVKLYLKAGSLRREITVKREATPQVLKNITTSYVGTFHRNNQMGERLVTWKYTGAWTAYIDNPASDIRIDRLPSLAFSDGSLYNATPSDAEISVLASDDVSVTGMNTIYFRVGWKHTQPANSQPRYATVTVRQGTNNPGGAVIQKLYIRQGEIASAVYGPPRTNPARFSPYNLTTPTGSGTVALKGGTFTAYPTQCGSYFQWMDQVNPRYAYPASGAATPWNANHPFYETYWTEENPGMASIYETCPAGYRRVTDGATGGEPTGTSELRQSLWDNPAAVNASNTLSGYYADGFFDRRSIMPGNNHVGTGQELAYRGRLFYNTATNASLFFPAAGQRIQATGVLSEAGIKGYYWSASSTIATAEPTGSQAYVSTRLRNAAMNIRCVAE